MTKKTLLIVLSSVLAALLAVVAALTIAFSVMGNKDKNDNGLDNNSSATDSDVNGDTDGDGDGDGDGNSVDGSTDPHLCDYELVTTVPSDCKNKGYDYYQCKVCKKDKYNYKPLSTTHSIKTTTREATCTTDMVEITGCSVCGLVESTKTYPNTKKEHDYSWTTVKAATCTKDGEKKGQCKSCIATTTDVIPATGHDYSWRETQKVSCLDMGISTGVCTDCGNETTKTTPALGHNYGTYTYNGDANCTKNGTKSAECGRCGNVNTIVDPLHTAPGHDYKLYSVLDGGGCGKLTDIKYKCEVCDDVKIETKILEHDIQHGICSWCHGFENPKKSDDGYWAIRYMAEFRFWIDSKEETVPPWEGCFGEVGVWFVITSRKGNELSFRVSESQINSFIGYGADFEYSQLNDNGIYGYKSGEFEGVLTNKKTGEEVTFKFTVGYRITDDGQYAEFEIHGSRYYQDEDGEWHWDSCMARNIFIILDTV